MNQEHNTGARILVVEDERPMRVALRDTLVAAGYRVIEAENGEVGLARAREERPELMLLDVMMPRLDGYSVCRELRRLNLTTPVLMLTAKGRVDDRVEGLDAGADDYLIKPFSLDELLARVRALLRRAHAEGGHAGMPLGSLSLGDLHLEFKEMRAVRGERVIHLTAKEWAMLRLLASSRGEVISRERFLDVVWGYTSFPTTRTVDTHIASLRSKLEDDPEIPRWILTVHGSGYRLEMGSHL